MYLRKNHHQGTLRYELRESYLEDGIYRHRRLMDLGPDPRAWIEYGGGNSFYVHKELEEALVDLGADFTDRELESIFLPYVDPRIRRIVERFQRTDPVRKPYKSYPREELFQRQQALHDFDKRRIHYLRFGRVDIGNLDSRPWPFLNVLLNKSRDEIEQILEDMERELSPWETRPYLYTALHCQSRFAHLLTRNSPEALDPEKVDDVFVQKLCHLNADPSFFSGVHNHDPDRLHDYLVRYLILYFDQPVQGPSREYVEDFIWKSASSILSEDVKEACSRLGINPDAFHAMDRRKLTRMYRARAKKAHPDHGGENETFVRVRAAYELLLQRKA
ncbi:MAG TPA: J domain-containing protein [Desulfobacteraceae bacterium]|nr:J domain-containing protein [Desulfobacteraceae bacterium]